METHFPGYKLINLNISPSMDSCGKTAINEEVVRLKDIIVQVQMLLYYISMVQHVTDDIFPCVRAQLRTSLASGLLISVFISGLLRNLIKE